VSTGPLRVVVAGAGVTGLSAAFYLQRLAEARRVRLDVTVIEAGSRVGGKVETVVRDGFVLEQGPDSLLARKADALEFARDVGLDGQWVRNRTGRSYLWADQRLHPIPPGIRMGIPTGLLPLLKSSLVSPLDKLRVVADAFRHQGALAHDQSMGRFLRRRFGNKLVDRLIEPVLSGMYGGNVDDCSLQAVMPQLYGMANRRRGSFTAAAPPRRHTGLAATADGQGQFLTFERGMQTLVTHAAARLHPGSIVKNAALRALEAHEQRYRLFIEGGRALDADAVVLALPSRVAGELSTSMGEIFRPLLQTPPASLVIIALAFKGPDVGIEQEGIGFLVPRDAGLTLSACTWMHSKWPHAAPRGAALLRCYVGRNRAGEMAAKTDESIAEAALHDLKRIMTIRGAPTFYQVTRWENAIPQYPVGHPERVKRARSALATNFPGVLVAGAAYGGAGLPDCIRQGKEAAHGVLDYLDTLAPPTRARAA
jgi:oxygen-dependent protoporphyrinogen oxidase